MATRQTLPPSAAETASQDSNFRMIDVGPKTATARRAVAEGRIAMGAEAYAMLKARRIPKGDVLAQAEVAGILAAKKTADLLPLCHPLPLDQVKVTHEFNDATNSLTLRCEAATTAKTGVEMEALTGVTAALLAVYDLVKAVDPALVISEVHLNTKEGGKSGYWTHPAYAAKSTPVAAPRPASTLAGTKAAVLTVSDRVSQGRASDGSGPLITGFLTERGAELAGHEVVADEKNRIASRLLEWAGQGVSLVICTGGTGLSPRDVTPEALEEIADRTIPGIGELLRQHGARHTPMASLSRSVGVLIRNTLVIALPGSSKAVAEGLETLDGILPHALHITRGGDHRGGHNERQG